jgi:CubicO group peptidase (beta-lactamase class C family)
MNLRKIVLSLIFLIFYTSLAYSNQRSDNPAAKSLKALKSFEDVVNQALKDNNLPGAAVAVVASGKVVYAKGFGFRDLEAKKPMTPNTLFAIGSTTKAMTTTVLGMLVDEGKLEWDKPLRNYLPMFRLSDPIISERITLRDLVTHRSGLPGHDLVWFNNNEITRAELVERIAHLELNADLRECWQYNNLMFMTAGYLAGQLSGDTWEEVMRKRLFEPLGMTRSNFSVTQSQKDNDFAYPYRRNGKKPERIPFRIVDVIGPAGSVNSSVNEMTRWLLFNLRGGKVGDQQLINPATLADIHSPQMVTGEPLRRPEISQSIYGMGWFINIYRGHRRIGHGGGIDGFSTSVMFFPDDDLGIVSFDNGELGELEIATLINNCIADRMLGLKPIDWLEQDKAKNKKQSEVKEDKEETKKEEGQQSEEEVKIPDTHPSHPLSAYAGEYQNPGYGTLKITLVNDALELTYNGLVSPLEHWHYDVWNGAEIESSGPVSFNNMKFLFHSDLEGHISAVQAAFEQKVAPIVFTKKLDR